MGRWVSPCTFVPAWQFTEVNWRIPILTIALLALFASGCFLYVRLYVAPKAHGIILFIAPSADMSQLAELEDSVVQRTPTSASLITDRYTDASLHFSYLSTAMARTTSRGDSDLAKAKLDTLFTQAQRSARRTGIITTASFTHAIAGTFYNPHPVASEANALAQPLFDPTPINVILGGKPPAVSDNPEHALMTEAQERGYQVIQSSQQIPDIPRWRTHFCWVLLTLLQV